MVTNVTNYSVNWCASTHTLESLFKKSEQMSVKPKKSVNKIEIPHQKWATWPVEKKVQCVDLWLKLGNLRVVAEKSGVSYQLVKEWRVMPWWKQVEDEILATRRVNVNNKLNEIVDTALDTIQDRLVNGDVIYDIKNGELKRKPVGLRDATGAATAILQRQHQIEARQKDEVDTQTTKSIQEQLTMLATEFARFNHRSNQNATDITFKELPNAVHEEREAGLQDGSQEVHESPVSSEEARGAEPSPS